MSKVTYDFTGERFVVTGASSGMGRQITIELAETGAIVLAIARRKERLKELEDKYPGKILSGVLDVCDSEKLSEAVDNFVVRYGKLHGAVHSAGIGASTPLRAYNEDAARAVMDVSFWSGVRLMQVVNKKKNSLPGCSSILFSSVAAHIGEKSFFAYSAAKAALQVVVRTFAKEIYPNGNRINTIAPGWVETEMTQWADETGTTAPKMFDRYLFGTGKVQDVSGMVLFLLSDRARWITGEDFVVDGGYLQGGYN